MSSAADPFGEHDRIRYRARLCVLGAEFDVASTDEALLGLAVEAFGRLPRQRLASRPRRLTVRLVLTEERGTWAAHRAPPRPALSAGANLLCATVDAGNFVIVDPAMARALVCISRAMLRHRYHARYELVELAFLTLAARAQSLVPLHAACIGAHGNGVLLMGRSGAGKSTLTLHALVGGLQVLGEDSAFVALEGLRVTGVPNFLHVASPALSFMPPTALRRAIERSPVIERRSGARKYQVDLRELSGRIARTPLRLAATVFLSRRMAGRRPALVPLEPSAASARLRREQPYAAALPNWRAFERRIAHVPAYELRRTEHPDDAIRLLAPLL